MRQQGRQHGKFGSIQLKDSSRLLAIINFAVHLLIVTAIGGGLRFLAGAAFFIFFGKGERREGLAAEMQTVGQSGYGQQIQREQQKDYELFHG